MSVRVRIKRSPRPTTTVHTTRDSAIDVARKAYPAKDLYVYNSKRNVISSPKGIETWGDAVNRVMKNYSEAWRRLANR